MMSCACGAVQRLRGMEAASYAREHLALVRATPGERALYLCPKDMVTVWRLVAAASADGPVLARLEGDEARAELGASSLEPAAEAFRNRLRLESARRSIAR